MTAFKSGVLDHGAVGKRRQDMFGSDYRPDLGTENGVDTTKQPDPPKTDPGHYPGYDDLSGLSDRSRLYVNGGARARAAEKSPRAAKGERAKLYGR